MNPADAEPIQGGPPPAERVLVTTPHSPKPADIEAARAAAAHLGAPFAPRERRRLERLCAEEGVDAVLVVGATRRTVRVPGGTDLDFHCSSGVLRVRSMLQGGSDPLVRACGLMPGDVVLDATAGQCADALVLAHAVGPQGRVIAVESSTALYGLLEWGVRAFRRGEPEVDAALGRIEVRRGDFRDVLAAMPPRSVDVVYFDPMFRTRASANRNFDTLRVVADPRPLAPADLALAVSRARRRVVVKDHRVGDELDRLGLQRFGDLRESTKVRFGVLEASGPVEVSA